jgi:peptidoglycan/xylan/chitin deacetylase (PgdA/CDA1 family)
MRLITAWWGIWQHMAHQLTVVMYHYVRDLAGSRAPRLKALDVADFRGQLAYFARHYQVVGVPDLFSALDGRQPLPPRALLLTFDDGYVDHFEFVLPELTARNWSGAFFPSAAAVRSGRVLDVNKIQMAIAMARDPIEVVDHVRARIDALQGRPGVPSYAELYARYSSMSRYDSPDVTVTKRILQRALTPVLREELVSALFARFVTEDEQALAEGLYLSSAQLREMIRAGMYVGSHGNEHIWLDGETPEGQRRQLVASLGFLASIGAPTDTWAIAYPYGGHNSSLIDQLPTLGCRAGFTGTTDIADLRQHAPLTLPRLDTIELPTSADADISPWTLRMS